MPTPMEQTLEQMLEQYRHEVGQKANELGFSGNWTYSMQAYANRVAAWMVGNPAWWKVQHSDRIL